MGGNYVASANLERDGRFFMLVPDTLRDPALRAFAYPGELEFFICDERDGDALFRLTATGAPSGRVRERSAYPDEQMFEAQKTGHSMEYRPRTAVLVNRDSRIQDAFDRLLADIDACSIDASRKNAAHLSNSAKKVG